MELGGNNPEAPVPNFIFVFVWDGLESIPELTDSVDGLSRLAARTGVQSSLLFSRSKCSRYMPYSSDTDTHIKHDAL